MGLDAYCYTGLERVGDDMAVEDDDTPGVVRIGPNMGEFSGRAVDVPPGVYTYDDCIAAFHGSYGGYGDWRDKLAKLAGYPALPASPGDPDCDHGERHNHSRGAWQATGGPFWELINFADNEGTLGTAVCQRLASDFARYQPEADAVEGVDADWFRFHYSQMRRAFAAAAVGHGAVVYR